MTDSREKGKFIVFEGLDGSGKSTQMRLLAKELTETGLKVSKTAEPTNGTVGKHIRTMLSESLDKDMHLQAALFLADRLEHITDLSEGINRSMDDGYTVICDRYYYSSFAYQGTKIDMDWVMDINLNCPKMLKPDLCIFLDVTPEECKKRLDKRCENLDLYEKDIALMKKVRENFFTVFEKLKDRENIVIIENNKDMYETAKECAAHVRSHFEK